MLTGSRLDVAQSTTLWPWPLTAPDRPRRKSSAVISLRSRADEPPSTTPSSCAAIALDRRDDVETRGADIAGLHAGGALRSVRAARYWISRLALPSLHRLGAEHGQVLRIVAPDIERQHREIARRGHLRLVVQSVRVDIMRGGQAHGAWPWRSSRRRTCRIDPDTASAIGDGDVVGRLDHENVERVLAVVIDEPTARPDLLGAWFQAFCEILIGVSRLIRALRDGSEGHIGRHQLGQRRRMPGLAAFIVVEHFAVCMSTSSIGLAATGPVSRSDAIRAAEWQAIAGIVDAGKATPDGRCSRCAACISGSGQAQQFAIPTDRVLNGTRARPLGQIRQFVGTSPAMEQRAPRFGQSVW